MAKYKIYNFSQSMLIPVFFEEQLIPGTLEFAIQTLVETRMDMSFQKRLFRQSRYLPQILIRQKMLRYSNHVWKKRQVGIMASCVIFRQASNCGLNQQISQISLNVR